MACLLCKSNNVKRIDKLCDNMKILGDTFPDTPSYINVCNCCGLVYIDMDISQKDILHYYTSGNCVPICYENLFGAEHTKKYFEHIYHTIEPYIDFDSKILDVGGGLGEFASFLKNLGYHNITIMDPAQISIESAAKKGIDTVKADSTQLIEAWTGKFDLILLIHVFEHIYAQNETLNNLKKMLKTDGMMYLEVPDASKYCNDENVPFYYYTYEHIAHMNQFDIRNISCLTGMELLDTQEYLKCEQYPSVYGLYKNGDKIKQAVYHDLGEDCAQAYLELCKTRSRKMTQKYCEKNESLVLWGIGASTAQLLSSGFDRCNVCELVDSNPRRQGMEYQVGTKKMKIISPSELQARIKKDDVIVVMSIMYKNSIIKQIKEMGFSNKIEALSKEDMLA